MLVVDNDELGNNKCVRVLTMSTSARTRMFVDRLGAVVVVAVAVDVHCVCKLERPERHTIDDKFL